MTNFESICKNAKAIMKATAADRNAWNKEYYSLSKLLRDAQEKKRMELTAPIFAQLGLPVDGKVKPSYILDSLTWQQFAEDKNGEAVPVIWSHVQKRDKGEPVFAEDGVTPVMVDRASRIKEGSWTMNKLALLISQRNSFLAAEEGK